MAPAIGPGVGAGFVRRRRAAGGPPTLGTLALSAATIAENSALGTLVGMLLGTTSGSTLALVDSAGSRFALSGGAIVAGSVGTDFETETAHSITVRETLAGATNSPRDTVLAVNVTDVSDSGSGNATLSNARISAGGEYILFDVAGGVWTGQINVNPALITLTGTVASVDGSGNSSPAVVPRRCGYRATFAAGVLTVWLAQPVYAGMTGLTITLADAAITAAGGGISSALSGAPVTNNSARAIGLPAARIVGVVEGRSTLRIGHDVINGQFAVEADGGHEGWLAGVRFDVTDGVTTVTRWASAMTRSRYQDTAIISNAQWDANRAGSAEGGLGVWSSGLISHTSFNDGEITVTMTAVPRVGGLPAARTESWTLACNSAGGYVQRVRYVDSVAGSDANDGLTAATAVLTLQRGCLLAGAEVNGATAKSVPIVRLVGGSPGSPRSYDMYVGSGSGTAVPSATHTWLTIEPAEGHSRDTVRIVNWGASQSGGASHRIRRLQLRDITHDISSTGGGTSSSVLQNVNTSVYPLASNPQAFAYRRVRVTHTLGKNGQLSESTTGALISSTADKRNRWWIAECEWTDANARGPSGSPTMWLRNSTFTDLSKDVFKEPEIVFGCTATRNRVSPLLAPVSQIPSGQAPQAGDVMTGLFSGYSATVASFVATSATAGTVILQAGADSFGFKSDDSLTHTLVTLSGVSGTFQVGETVRNAGDSIRAVIFAITATTLRVRFTAGSAFSAGTLTGVTSGATGTWVSNAIQQNITVTRGGTEVFRMQINPPHPDGIQVQAFRPQELRIEGVTGSFVVGDVVTLASPTRTLTAAAVQNLGGGVWLLTGPEGSASQWVESAAGTVTGSISGATGNFVSARHVNNDFNAVFHNVIFREIDGQMLFGENGNRAMSLANVLGVRIDALSPSVSQIGLYDVVMRHVTLANQPFRHRTFLNSGSDATRLARASFAIGGVCRYVIAPSFSTDLRAPNAVSGDDAGLPGLDSFGSHTIVVGQFSTQMAGMSAGDPLWIAGVGPTEEDNPALSDYRVGVGSPARNRVPAGQRELRFDLLGVERRNDGTGAAGALEAA